MQFEYKTVYFNRPNFFTSAVDVKLLDEKLNEYAGKGWELVSFNTVGLTGRSAFIVLKRPKDGAGPH